MVTVTVYAVVAAELALRMRTASPLPSDTLYTTGSNSTVISTAIYKGRTVDKLKFDFDGKVPSYIPIHHLMLHH